MTTADPQVSRQTPARRGGLPFLSLFTERYFLVVAAWPSLLLMLFVTAIPFGVTLALAFTNYEMRMPGADKILLTDDDWIARDGVIMKLADVAKGGVGRSVSAGVLNP